MSSRSNSILDNQNAATKTFNVPELLEIILDNVEIQEIMTLWQVSRSTRAIIESSSKLQKRLSLETNLSGSKSEMPFESCLTGLPSHFRCFQYPWGALRPFGIRATCYLTKDKRLPRIGSRYRSMFIAQPPPKEVRAYVSPSLDPQDTKKFELTTPLFSDERFTGIVSSTDGLRIGDLFDSAQEMTANYENRPFCDHPEKGWRLCFAYLYDDPKAFWADE